MPVELFRACIQPTGTTTLKTTTMSTDDDDEEEEPIECNYDTDLIALYQALEERAWIPALDLIHRDNVDSKNQVRTWVTRYEPSGNVRWSQLPIHAAMIFQAPFKVVQALVDAYPKGVRCTDDQHMLPLHLAFRYGVPDNTLLLLLEAFPEAMNAKNRKGRVPALCACPEKPHRSKLVRYHIDNTKQIILEDRPDKKAVAKQMTEMEERLEAQSKKVEALEQEKEDWIVKEQELQAKIEAMEGQLSTLLSASDPDQQAATATGEPQSSSAASTKSVVSASAKSSKSKSSAVSSKKQKSQRPDPSGVAQEQAGTSSTAAADNKSISTKKSVSTKGSSGSDKSKNTKTSNASTKKSVRSSLGSKLFRMNSGKKKSKAGDAPDADAAAPVVAAE